MVPHFSKVHNRFKLDGRHYDHASLKEVAYSYVKEGEPYERRIGDFLMDWLNSKPYLIVKTSGSTGKPKSIRLEKQAMVHSAIATGDFFKLQPGDSALLCLPTDYIAGKMMLVRAMILGLEIDLAVPASQLYINTKRHYKFAAMTPMQLHKSTKSIAGINILIIGGAKVSQQLKEKVRHIKTKLYETYGMTETITHIAVKTFGENYFKVLPNITITRDERQCLEIFAPYISNNKIITNDIIELHSETEFEWLGRYDNVINSGGIKIHPEQLEEALASKIDCNFFISSVKDEKLGERLVLVVEDETNTLEATILDGLDKLKRPKEILFKSKFNYTKSGKIDRVQTLNSILGHA